MRYCQHFLSPLSIRINFDSKKNIRCILFRLVLKNAGVTFWASIIWNLFFLLFLSFEFLREIYFRI
jgi:hypothetical protein